MSYLLDTNICLVHFRRPARLAHRLMQYAGRLALSTVNLGELYTWAYKQDDPAPILQQIDEFLRDVRVLPFDADCALMLGRIRGPLLRRGIVVPSPELMIAATAIVHGLTLVTHNTRDFEHVPGLQIEDWLAP